MNHAHKLFAYHNSQRDMGMHEKQLAGALAGSYYAFARKSEEGRPDYADSFMAFNPRRAVSLSSDIYSDAFSRGYSEFSRLIES